MSDGENTRRCQGITSGGARCQKLVGASQSFCYSHDPDAAQRRNENASKAARARHGTPSDEILEIRQEMKELATSVRERKVTPGIGSVVNQILGNVLKTFDQERRQREFDELAHKVTELEKHFQEQKELYG